MKSKALCIALVLAILPPLGVGAADEDKRLFLDVTLNGMAEGESLVVLRAGDALVRAEDLKDSTLVVPADAYVLVDKKRYVSIKGIDRDAKITIDEDAMTISIVLGATSYAKTEMDLTARNRDLKLTPGPLGAYVNYGIAGGSGIAPSFSGVAVVSAGRASLQTSIDIGGGYQQHGAVHGANLVIDGFERAERLTIGESTLDMSDFSGGGGAAVIQGVSLVRSLAFNPNYVRSNSSGVSGIANSASTVQVYVNGVLVQNVAVPAGPFEIKNLPMQNGANNTKVVIRDAFGSVQTVERPEYFAGALLGAGQREFQLAVGRLSEATGGFAGKGGVAGARLDAGVTKHLTVSGHASGSTAVTNVGGAFTVDSTLGTLSAAYSASRGRVVPLADAGTVIDLAQPASRAPLAAAVAALQPGAQVAGSSYALSYAKTLGGVSVGASTVRNSPTYATISLPALGDRIIRATNLMISANLGRLAQFSVTSTSTTNRDSAPIREIHTSLLSRVGQRSTVTLNVIRSRIGAFVSNSVGVSAAMQLGHHMSVAVSQSESGSTVSRDFVAQKTFDNERARGSYQLEVGSGGGQSVQRLRSDVQTPWGDGLFEEVSAGGSRPALSASLSGSLAFADGALFAGRPINGGFAVIKVDGLSGITATVNNDRSLRSDRAGRIFATSIFGDARNQVSIDTARLPENVIVDNAEQVVTPAYRGGSLIRFTGRKIHAYTGYVTLAGAGGGNPDYGVIELRTPAGVLTSDVGVGGVFYFEALAPGRYAGRVRFKGGECAITIVTPAGDGLVTKLGSVPCRLEADR